MTLDQLVAKAARQLDKIYIDRIDVNVLRMFECGHDDAEVLDHIETQRRVYEPWRVETLANIRTSLLAERHVDWTTDAL